MTAAYGCAQNARPALDARSAPGGLDVRPAPTLVPSDLAYGARQWSGPSKRLRTPQIDEFLKPEALVSTAPRAPADRRPEPARDRTPAKALPAQAPAIRYEPAPEVAAQQDATPAVLAERPLQSDLEQYAQREQRSRDLQAYKGGDAIVIGSSTLIIALLIVLLIVLLT